MMETLTLLFFVIFDCNLMPWFYEKHASSKTSNRKLFTIFYQIICHYLSLPIYDFMPWVRSYKQFLYKNRSFRRSWASAEQLLIQPSVFVLVINIFRRPPVLFTMYCRRIVHLFREGALVQYFLYTVIYTECRSTEHLLCWTEAQAPWLN
jgi:hypothetical protein